jgi:hypothetical protein
MIDKRRLTHHSSGTFNSIADMITLRPASERGHHENEWLDTRHTFSFGSYHDPAHSGFRSLLVINEDRVAPDEGFGMHSHKDMEILTYVIAGALEHNDNLNNGTVILPGDVQRMTAGRGIEHAEFNHSETEGVHFLQIWITPRAPGLIPGYEQRTFLDIEKSGRLLLVASGDGREDSVTIHQDADLYLAVLNEGDEVGHTLRDGRGAWLQVARGRVMLGGAESFELRAGDGAAIVDETAIAIRGIEEAEILLFDLA